MTLVSIPEDADAQNIESMLSCLNPTWAQVNPHRAWQVHTECDVGVCVTKSVAWNTLVEQGKVIPDSGRVR